MADITDARNILRSALKKSRDTSSQINKTGVWVRESKQRLAPFESAFKSIAQKCSLLTVRGQIDRAVGPAAAVIEVYNVVNGLEISLLRNPCSDLFPYLSLAKQLEEALRFLTNNSVLVICWLEDVVLFFENNKFVDDWYLSSVKRCVCILRELQAMEHTSRLDGRPLCIALEKLENEFHLILLANAFPMALSSTNMHANALPVPVIQKLQAILERSNANNRIGKCMSIYVQVRSSNAKSTMEALGLDYLDASLSEFDSVQSIESSIDQWCTHLEIVVKQVLELEYTLCNQIFQKVGSKTRIDCFSEIAVRSGIQSFIEFGNTITKGKKDAIKLLKLLEIFGALNKLRLDFNRIFVGKGCREIQTQTRDLIKKVVNGACEIFYELSVQVELQKESIPPTDGSVPRLVTFVTEFCNELLEDDCKLILIQVLEIQMSWQNKSLEEGFVSKEIYKIMRAIEMNLESWVSAYKGTALSYIFIMNSHCYLSKNLSGTKLGDLMGDSWLKTHEQAMEYNAALYSRESWGKLAAVLKEDGLVNVEKRINDFNTGFEDIYKEQSRWVVPDKRLRSKICKVAVENIVPMYTTFYKGLIEQGTSPNTSVRYSAEALEDMLSCLFQPKLRKYSNRHNTTKCTHLVGNVTNVASTHFSSTPAAARVF